ncbi:hypothetical protein BDN72DRAFT_285084 [Pluteus cervinus]|uniref:Uncharacterized protein n=1 Tax=Pluteus cervinus TaxID=181527 RepID=A0ACD3AEX1_9AGAR|nr:hypothetical protein BDN72DRAFT_285084 [Pluteus cervinus]
MKARNLVRSQEGLHFAQHRVRSVENVAANDAGIDCLFGLTFASAFLTPSSFAYSSATAVPSFYFYLSTPGPIPYRRSIQRPFWKATVASSVAISHCLADGQRNNHESYHVPCLDARNLQRKIGNEQERVLRTIPYIEYHATPHPQRISSFVPPPLLGPQAQTQELQLKACLSSISYKEPFCCTLDGPCCLAFTPHSRRKIIFPFIVSISSKGFSSLSSSFKLNQSTRRRTPDLEQTT